MFDVSSSFPRLLTARVSGTQPEDWQVSTQVLYLAAEKRRVRDGRVGRHPDQIVLEFGWHDFVLLQGARRATITTGTSEDVAGCRSVTQHVFL